MPILHCCVFTSFIIVQYILLNNLKMGCKIRDRLCCICENCKICGKKLYVYFAAVPFIIVATLLNTPVIPLG